MEFINKLDCLLINLDRSPERLAQMQERLACFNLPFRRVPAVDGKKVTFTEREINALEYERCHGKYVTPTEVACYISHYNAFQLFLESDKEYALILEDDMVLCDDFLFVLDGLMKNHQDWDMVKLNSTGSWGFPIARKIIFKEYRLVFNLLHKPKSGAYLVNRYAARKFIQNLLPMIVPYDHEFIKFWKYNIRLFSVLPFPTWEQGEASTIDYVMARKNKKPWYKRLNTFAYRAKIALIRLWYASKSSFGATKPKF